MKPPRPIPGGRLRTSEATAFILRAGLWVVVLFAILRLPWVQQKLLLPFAAFQGRIGCALFGTTVRQGFVGLSCTGADPMALATGAILAFPMAWKRRLIGAAIGLGIILGLNTVRIGHLSLLVGQPAPFRLFHVYLWPALLIVAAAGWVLFWMSRPTGDASPGSSRAPARGLALPRGGARRFIGLTLILVALFYLASGWIMRADAVGEVARWATVLAGGILAALGVAAEVTGNRLTTGSGAWVVTPACVATPLIAVYLAAVLAVAISPLKKALAVLAALPLFLLLGTGRLLVLALPAALVGSHFVAIHAFYQSLAAAVIVAVAALGIGGDPAPRRSSGVGRFSWACGAGLLAFVVWQAAARWLLRPGLERLGDTLHLGHGYSDPQGALLLLPPFQMALLVALWISLRRPLWSRSFVIAVTAVAISQALIVVALGEMAIHFEIEAPIVAIRAMSLGVPLLAAWWLTPERRRAPSEPVPEPAPSHG